MPWLFGLFLTGLLILLALVLSVARMKFVGVDELPGPSPTQHGSQIDHSFPFLESLNEVLETNRVEESQSHVHRMYFMGPNTFSEPRHLPHTPPEQIQDIVYEGAFNTFVDEINGIAAYQWWEGAIHSILSVVGYPLACSCQQCRRRLKLQRLREFVRSEYDHACLRSCRSRALYEGIKVNATANLMLAYMDFFLGGDEKRTDLPPLNLIHYNWGLNLVRNFDDGGVGVVDLLCSSGEHDDAGRVRNGERSMLFTDSGSFTTSHDDDDDDDSDAGGERGCSCSGSGVVHELVHNVVSINGWLRRFFSSWQKGDVLGKGSFGTVYEGFTEIFFLSQKRRMLRRKLLILVYLILLGQMKICCWYFPLAH